jgi:hypothetical protein
VRGRPTPKKRTFRKDGLVLLFSVVGCRPRVTTQATPLFVIYPQPELTLGLDAFTDAGCVFYDNWFVTCPDDGPVADGYLVNLFSRNRCTTRSKVIRITYHGEFTLVSREDIYRVPEERCVYVE